ncbi:MAG: hypothetical protein ABR505_00850 [Actinomycetota bacterium]
MFSRIKAIFVVSALVVGIAVAIPTAAGRERKPLRGSFDAVAEPTASYYLSSNCLDTAHSTAEDVEVPQAGMLTVTMTEFTGDWDVWLNVGAKSFVAGAYSAQGPLEDGKERFQHYINKPGTVTIVACNYTGGPTAHVDYVVRFGPRSDFVAPLEIPLRERLPVNFVFVGFEPSHVKKEFVKELPKIYRPVVRTQAYSRTERKLLGIEHLFDYNLVFTDDEYEDRLFGWMKRSATEAPITRWQTNYNNQQTNRIDIDGNYLIRADAMERWLAANPPAGVDTTQYTAFFVNWYDRKDFRFHLFHKPGEPDADMGFDFAIYDDSYTIAWGGTPPTDAETPMEDVRRVWFYDMSAGPDWRTGNWRVDDASRGRTIPPVWEYDEEGARRPDLLGTDLGLLARYVAIDLLFTPSPIYPPSITPPAQPTRINLDINTYEGNPAVDASETLVKDEVILTELRDLVPTSKWDLDTQDLDYYEPRQQACFQHYVTILLAGGQGAWPAYASPSCYPDRGYAAWSNLFLYNALRLDETRDTSAADYEAMGYLYSVPGYHPMPWSGLADNNQATGLQSMIYTATVDEWRLRGYGPTDTIIHEYGHHFGLPHPHDGYDYERARHIGPYGQMYFVWAGDETNDVMSYLNVNNDFGQFNRDSMDRWLTATYLAQARTIARKIGDPGVSHRVESHLQAAIDAFAAHEYEQALTHARAGYERALAAARKAGIKIEGSQEALQVRDSVLPAALNSPVRQSAWIDFMGPHRLGWSAWNRQHD